MMADLVFLPLPSFSGNPFQTVRLPFVLAGHECRSWRKLANRNHEVACERDVLGLSASPIQTAPSERPVHLFPDLRTETLSAPAAARCAPNGCHKPQTG